MTATISNKMVTITVTVMASVRVMPREREGVIRFSAQAQGSATAMKLPRVARDVKPAISTSFSMYQSR